MKPSKLRQEVLKSLTPRIKDTKSIAKVYHEMLSDPIAYSFMLPVNGEIVKHTTPIHLKFEDLKLPFDKCVFEYSVEASFYNGEHPDYDQPDSTVLIVEKTEDSLTLFPIWHTRNKLTNTPAWAPSMYGVMINADSFIEVREDRTVGVGAPKIVIPAEAAFGRVYETLTEESMQQLVLDVMDELRVVAHFAMLCGCDNVTPKKVHTVSEEAARIAKLRGKPRPYDYWVLDVYMSDTQESYEGGSGGSHASPRFHVRRGHIRRYQTGKTTWVRQCAVGTPELGVIEKTYRVNK